MAPGLLLLMTSAEPREFVRGLSQLRVGVLTLASAYYHLVYRALEDLFFVQDFL